MPLLALQPVRHNGPTAFNTVTLISCQHRLPPRKLVLQQTKYPHRLLAQHLLRNGAQTLLKQRLHLCHPLRILFKRRLKSVGPTGYRLHHQRISIFGKTVQGLLGHTGPLRHRVHGSGGIALRQQQRQCGLNRRRAQFRFRGRRPSARARFGIPFICHDGSSKSLTETAYRHSLNLETNIVS
ncbi:hypothetical protein D3C79_436930 [compost metagenome]